MTVPGAPRTDPDGTGGDPAARGRFGLSSVFRRTPGHIGRARTSTLVLGLLFAGLGILYLYVRPPDPATDPAGGTTQVSTPAPAPARTTEPVPTTPEETPSPTTTAPTTDLPTESGSTTPSLPTGSRTTEPSETEPGEPAPTTDQAPSTGEAPAPTPGGTPTP